MLPLKDVHILMPNILQGKSDFACVIKLRILRCRDYPGLSWWDPNVITRVLIRKEKGKGVRGDRQPQQMSE